MLTSEQKWDLFGGLISLGMVVYSIVRYPPPIVSEFLPMLGMFTSVGIYYIWRATSR